MFAYDNPEEKSVKEHLTAINTLISCNETVVWFSNKLVEIHENIVTLESVIMYAIPAFMPLGSMFSEPLPVAIDL